MIENLPKFPVSELYIHLNGERREKNLIQTEEREGAG
jgi:hypothetical protein